MSKIKLKEFKPGNKNKLFFVLNMMSGDADGYEDYEIPFSSTPELKHINFSSLNEHLKEVESFAKKLKVLAQITDVNHRLYLESYEQVNETHGEWMASMYENLPYDITCQDVHSSIEEIQLVGYSQDNVKYTYNFQ